MTTRRIFIKNGTITTAGIGLVSSLTGSMISCAASDRINVGLIGCRGMGFTDLKAFLANPEVDCIALCDVDDRVLQARAVDVEKIRGKKPANFYKDWRKLIYNKDIDVVIIGTPDHWHCLQMIGACEAGKDVYCEKPIGRTVEECNLMVKAAQKYNRVVQVGQWQRSDPHWQNSVDFIHSGKLGKIRLVRVCCYLGWTQSVPVFPDEAAPAGVDYDMWQGPAPNRPYNKNRFHNNFRWFWDYAGGLMTDWGVHLLDYALYGMNVSQPRSIVGMGGKYAYPDDACETPDSLQVMYKFDDFNIIWDHAMGIRDGGFGHTHGVAFVGENGTLIVDRDGWEVKPEVVKKVSRMDAIPLQKGTGQGLSNHVRNFLDCVKRRDRNTNASIEIGAHIAKFSHLGNIALRTDKKLDWDGTRFTNDLEANNYLVPVYRDPWKLPTI